MQKRPSVVYIRHRSCKRRNVRCCLFFVFVWVLLLCAGMKLLQGLVWAGVLTCVFRFAVLKKMG